MNDEFTWSTYTDEHYYPQQLQIIRENHCDLFISPSGITYNGDEIEFNDNLHPNSKELYYIVHKLHPQSILECGCGAGISLKNLEIIVPNTEIYGVDISEKQIQMSKWFTKVSNNISNRMSVMDITKQIPYRKFDFVFSNAVIMHLIQDRAVNALNNMKNASNKYVYLSENKTPNRNRFISLVEDIFKDWQITYLNKFIKEDNPFVGILLKKTEHGIIYL